MPEAGEDGNVQINLDDKFDFDLDKQPVVEEVDDEL